MRRKNRQTEISKKAEELFAVQGYNHTTIAQIAKASRISEASIYGYFKNKTDLFYSIPERYFSQLCQSLDRHLLGIKSPHNKLTKLIWHYLMFMEENQRFSRIYMLDLWSNRGFYQSRRSLTLLSYWNYIGAILQEGIDEGVFDTSLDIVLCQCMIMGTITHLILTALVLDRPLTLINKAESIEEIVISAVKCNPKTLSFGPIKDKKEAILRASLEEFGKHGYAQTTIANISHAAGISDPTIYEYFKGKEEILMAIPEYAVDSFLTGLKDSFDTINRPEVSFKLMLWEQARSYDEYPVYYQILLEELNTNPAFYKTRGYEVARQYIDEFTRIMKSGIERGDFRSDIDLGLIRHMYFGLFDQLFLYSTIRPNEFRIAEKINGVYELIMKVVKKPSNGIKL